MTTIQTHDMSDVQCQHSGETSCAKPACQQVDNFIEQASVLCSNRNQRFTELRKQVLSLICQSEQPVGAYALLDSMRESGRSAAPPTVYRALDFLLEQGLVHRLVTNNTYLACAHPQRKHEAVFLVCKQCGYTRELHTDGIYKSVALQAKKASFKIEHASVEVIGLCNSCQKSISGNHENK